MHLDDPCIITREHVQSIQRFGARVVKTGDGQHCGTGDERRERGGDEGEGQCAVDERLGATGPDPTRACGGDGEDGRDDVDDETPLFVRLEAEDCEEEEVGEEDVEGLAAEDGDAEGEGEADLVDERIEQEAGEGGGEVKMPGGGAPVGRLLVDDVEDEAGQFGPEGPSLPEEAVDWDREGETDERA